jgi:hypothetical protein
LNITDIVMSCAKNNTLIRTNHYINQVKLRQNGIVPDDDGIIYLMSTETPVHIEKQPNDRFKLFYIIDVTYDLIIVISIKSYSPRTINLITVHQQEAKRRPGK